MRRRIAAVILRTHVLQSGRKPAARRLRQVAVIGPEVPGTFQQQGRVSDGHQPGQQRGEAFAARRQKAGHGIDAKVGRRLEGVADAEDHQPGEEHQDDFQRPDDRLVEDISKQHVHESQKRHHAKQEGDRDLFEPVNDMTQSAFRYIALGHDVPSLA